MISSTIKKLREEKGFSQQQIADHLGITRQTYSNVEKGISKLSLGAAVKLADLYGVTIDHFMNQDTKMTATTDTNREKYKQIIKSCIKYGSGSDGKITKTKLAKLCYLVDFARFYNHLNSLTGLEYRRIRQGPVPDAYFTTIEELEQQQSIAVTKKGTAYMIENISENGGDLDAEELGLIKKICKKRQKADTQEIVDFTHKQLPWMLCQDKEIIPYEFITQEEPENVY
ncbi:MAG: helix-turn-helix domain-containing protein [Candidatus Absconditabacterales bacterium]